MKPLRGLYAITPAYQTQDAPLTEQVQLAIAGGARLIQYRDKTDEADRRRREVGALLAVCRAAGVPLIVNDDVELALSAGADGVHLGRDDPDPAAARRRLGAGAVIGVSCYDQLARAREAQAAGADYIAFGRFFRSASKPQATPADPELLRQARRELDLPLVAIGGITPDNAPALLAAGADLLAVIHGVFGQGDVRAAAQGYARLFPA